MRNPLEDGIYPGQENLEWTVLSYLVTSITATLTDRNHPGKLTVVELNTSLLRNKKHGQPVVELVSIRKERYVFYPPTLLQQVFLLKN